MLLTLDIGNTNIKTALFDGERLLKYWRISTNKMNTSDEYGILLCNMFAHDGFRTEDVKGIIISSVVPTINFTIEHMCQDYFGLAPMFVEPGITTVLGSRKAAAARSSPPGSAAR